MNALGPHLAALNAILNGSSALLLLAGLIAIKLKKVKIHRFLMVSAFSTSILFLISYLTRFYLTGVHRFEGDPFIRKIYLTILISHTSLAAATPFLAIRTLYLAYKKRFDSHKKIARIAWPIWMYVSVTGVVVYWMLYRF
ncbi:MAG: DUF420 domain-containing protein [Deltaproteobacteria bacterium]|nr:DUF420 domain-containing protein [Deltaproteobacteria bacterium]MBI4373706.1 DUF420 domain-containing protein [Deltaproteobacteria bacterium]